MTKYEHEQEGYVHPMLDQARDLLARGKMDRREFVRSAALLGVSATAAYAMAGSIVGEDFAPAALADDGPPNMDSVLRFSMVIQKMEDPAQFSWVEMSNVARHMGEFLTITGPDNVTRPFLAESWSASDDLKTWTFVLRQGVTWNNGDAFTSEDVAHNIRRWLDPDTGSSNLGLFGTMTEEYDTGEKHDDGSAVMGRRGRADAVEVVDEHTVRLHLNTAALAIPENFYNYPTMIMHRSFGAEGGLEPDFSKNPVGTGPYTLEEHRVGEIAVLKRRDDYWGEAPYLAEIRYIDHGTESQQMINALASNEVDAIYEIGVNDLEFAELIPGAVVQEAATAQTGVCRFHITEKPFDDVRVRQAMMKCVDPSRYTDVVYQGYGQPGEHHHVAPIHPEYFPLAAPQQDIEGAKALLADAGYGDDNPLEVSIECGNTNGEWQQQVCELLKEDMAKAGIDLTINVVPSSKYWEVWKTTPFGITSWTHRPLGTMVLSLAYRSGVPWNETNYANPEFDAALDAAEALLDVDERREQMEVVEKMLQDDAIFLQPLWRPVFNLKTDKVHGMSAHPTQYHQFNKVWVES